MVHALIVNVSLHFEGCAVTAPCACKSLRPASPYYRAAKVDCRAAELPTDAIFPAV